MKRRKTRTSSEASNPTSSPSPHQEKKVAKTTAISSSSSATLKKSITITAETKASTLNIEDTEMEKRDAAKDVDSFQSACGEISKLVEEIQDLKKQGKEPTVCCFSSWQLCILECRFCVSDPDVEIGVYLYL